MVKGYLNTYKPKHHYEEEELDVSKKTSSRKSKPSINKQLSEYNVRKSYHKLTKYRIRIFAD